MPALNSILHRRELSCVWHCSLHSTLLALPHRSSTPLPPPPPTLRYVIRLLAVIGLPGVSVAVVARLQLSSAAVPPCSLIASNWLWSFCLSRLSRNNPCFLSNKSARNSASIWSRRLISSSLIWLSADKAFRRRALAVAARRIKHSCCLACSLPANCSMADLSVSQSIADWRKALSFSMRTAVW